MLYGSLSDRWHLTDRHKYLFLLHHLASPLYSSLTLKEGSLIEREDGVVRNEAVARVPQSRKLALFLEDAVNHGLIGPCKSQRQKRLTVIPLMDVLSDFTEEHIILGVSLYACRYVKAILLPGTQLNWLRDILSVCQVFIA